MNSQHEYEVLMTQFNTLNIEVLDYKQENKNLNEQKKEFLEKLDLNDVSHKESVYKPDVRIPMCLDVSCSLLILYFFFFRNKIN